MKGVYGYDIKSKTYWYYIEVYGIEVKSQRNISRKELESIKEKNKFLLWYKETDYAF